jgi:hypothetical protein
MTSSPSPPWMASEPAPFGLVDVEGYALMVNSLAIHRHRARSGTSPPLAA